MHSSPGSASGRSKVASGSVRKYSKPIVPRAHSADGNKRFPMRGPVVTCPPRYNIVEVISPMGVQAPPALEATTMTPPTCMRNCVSLMSFCMREIITITTVRLLRTEESANVIKPTTTTRSRRFDALIALVMISKPLCASMISTMVRAPSRKNTTSETSSKLSFKSIENCAGVICTPVPTNTQTSTPSRSAVAALLISSTSSRTIVA
mmetsp:Transcript_5653/g.11250  ORF Transcript_5653/g.11250 Transcript_5653/m.11250 type:complete len:207 (-) Transcript_5653:543-1163(-)